MTQTKREVYRKAYTELNEIINAALSFEIDKIPTEVLDNLRSQMDTEYTWNYDYSRNLMDQDMMVETKALLIEIYARYLCPEEDKERWEKYNNICTELIEEEKIRQFDQNRIFNNNMEEPYYDEMQESDISSGEIKVEEVEVQESLVSKKESIITKILKAFKNMFRK